MRETGILLSKSQLNVKFSSGIVCNKPRGARIILIWMMATKKERS